MDNKDTLLAGERKIVEAEYSGLMFLVHYMLIILTSIASLGILLSDTLTALSYVYGTDESTIAFFIITIETAFIILVILDIKFIKKHTYLVVTDKRVHIERVMFNVFGVQNISIPLEEISSVGTLDLIWGLLRLFVSCRTVFIGSTGHPTFHIGYINNYDAVYGAITENKLKHGTTVNSIEDFSAIG
jgi:hypothetical protein